MRKRSGVLRSRARREKAQTKSRKERGVARKNKNTRELREVIARRQREQLFGGHRKVLTRHGIGVSKPKIMPWAKPRDSDRLRLNGYVCRFRRTLKSGKPIVPNVPVEELQRIWQKGHAGIPRNMFHMMLNRMARSKAGDGSVVVADVVVRKKAGASCTKEQRRNNSTTTLTTAAAVPRAELGRKGREFLVANKNRQPDCTYKLNDPVRRADRHKTNGDVYCMKCGVRCSKTGDKPRWTHGEPRRVLQFKIVKKGAVAERPEAPGQAVKTAATTAAGFPLLDTEPAEEPPASVVTTVATQVAEPAACAHESLPAHTAAAQPVDPSPPPVSPNGPDGPKQGVEEPHPGPAAGPVVAPNAAPAPLACLSGFRVPPRTFFAWEQAIPWLAYRTTWFVHETDVDLDPREADDRLVADRNVKRINAPLRVIKLEALIIRQPVLLAWLLSLMLFVVLMCVHAWELSIWIPLAMSALIILLFCFMFRYSRVTYVPHIVSSVLRETHNFELVTAATARQMVLRLSSLPLKDEQYIEFREGSVRVVRALASHEDFLRGDGGTLQGLAMFMRGATALVKSGWRSLLHICLTVARYLYGYRLLAVPVRAFIAGCRWVMSQIWRLFHRMQTTLKRLFLALRNVCYVMFPVRNPIFWLICAAMLIVFATVISIPYLRAQTISPDSVNGSSAPLTMSSADSSSLTGRVLTIFPSPSSVAASTSLDLSSTKIIPSISTRAQLIRVLTVLKLIVAHTFTQLKRKCSSFLSLLNF